MLDERGLRLHDVGVKITFLHLSLVLVLGLVCTSCKPESIDPQRLGVILEQNAKLQKSMMLMQQSIDRAGELDPSLAQRTEQLEKEMSESIQELNQLADEGHLSEMRLLELESRLKSFEATFTKMQNEAKTTAQH